MNDFFKLTTGEQPEDTKGEFDASGGFDPLPDKTQVLAAPDEAKWAAPHIDSGTVDKLPSLVPDSCGDALPHPVGVVAEHGFLLKWWTSEESNLAVVPPSP